MKLIPRQEFESLAKQHRNWRSFREAYRWNQIVAPAFAQINGRQGLRDIISFLSILAHRLYPVGSQFLARNTLSRTSIDISNLIELLRVIR